MHDKQAFMPQKGIKITDELGLRSNGDDPQMLLLDVSAHLCVACRTST